MKNKLLSFVLFFFTFSLSAQNWFDENQTWAYSSGIYDGLSGIETVQIMGDTTLNGQSCHIFEHILEGTYWMQTNIETIQFETYAYEESDVVYVYFEDEFQPIYDFNLNVGDTLSFNALWCDQPVQYVILETGTTQFGDEELRFQEALTIPYNSVGLSHNITIVEKMGFVKSIGENGDPFYDGFLFLHESFYCGFDYYPVRFFNCYSDEDILNYSPEDKPCEFVLSANEIGQLGAVTLYPNPANKWLHLDIPNQDKLAKIQILDLNGRLIQAFESPENTIQIEEFSSGIYLLELESKDGERGVLKWVKE